jgi:hypothetical protein
MSGRVLHVSERHAGIERGRDKSVTQRVWRDGVLDACLAREASHDLLRGVPVHLPAGARDEQRTVRPTGEHHVECVGGARRERDGLSLAALTAQSQCAVSALVR